MKKLMIVISMVVLSAAVVFSYGFYRAKTIRSSAEQTVTSFIKAANDQNVNRLLGYIEPTEAQLIELAVERLDSVTDSTAFTKFKKWLPYIADATDLEPIPQFDTRILVTAIEDNSADVNAVLVNTKNDTETECTFKLILIDEKWYVQYVRPAN